DTSSPECIVCNGEPGDSDFSLVVPTLSCIHPRQVCGVCIRHIIRMFVTSGEYVEGIPCPSTGCPQKLRYYDVEKWAAPAVFERQVLLSVLNMPRISSIFRFDKSLLQDHLRTGKRYVRCIARGCPAGQEHTGKESNNIVTCYSCGTKQCFTHQTKWHEGFTCAQWDEHMQISLEQQAMTEEWIQKETKPCSGPGCGKRIQKVDGCDHMTCRPPGGCGYQFCWFCLAPWLEIIAHDNSRHYDHCKHYTGLP
ncbi:hypothetical protein M408DRAFT_43062, partial [Serendipita vermifera MAFF 305830]